MTFCPSPPVTSTCHVTARQLDRRATDVFHYVITPTRVSGNTRRYPDIWRSVKWSAGFWSDRTVSPFLGPLSGQVLSRRSAHTAFHCHVQLSVAAQDRYSILRPGYSPLETVRLVRGGCRWICWGCRRRSKNDTPQLLDEERLANRRACLPYRPLVRQHETASWDHALTKSSHNSTKSPAITVLTAWQRASSLLHINHKVVYNDAELLSSFKQSLSSRCVACCQPYQKPLNSFQFGCSALFTDEVMRRRLCPCHRTLANLSMQTGQVPSRCYHC